MKHGHSNSYSQTKNDQIIKQSQVVNSSSKDKARSTVSFILRSGLSFGVLALLVFSVDLNEIYHILSGVKLNILGLTLLVGLFERFLNTWRWQFMLKAHNIDLRMWPLFRIQLTSGCLGLFLPSALGVDVLRMVAISRCTDKPVEAIASSAFDRVLTVGITLIVASITGLVAGGRYMPWSISFIMVSLCLFFFMTGYILSRPTLAKFFSPLLEKFLSVSFFIKLQTFFKGILFFRDRLGIIAAASLFTLVILLVRILIVYLEAMALNVHLEFVQLAIVLPLVWIILMFPISLGGLGLQEGAFFLALRGIGVSGSGAISISILDHLVVRLVGLPGLYFYFRGGLVGGNLKQVQLVNDSKL